MVLTVFAGPDPDANLDELFRRTPLSRTPLCAVVPDARSAGAFERRAARSASGAVLGCRVYTFEGLARTVAALDGPAPESVPPHIRRALLGEIAVGRIGDRSRWFGISRTAGFTDLLLSLLEEHRGRLAPPPLDPELRGVVNAYDLHLARLGMNDHEGMLRAALAGDILERFAASFAGPLILDGFYDLTETQFTLVSRLTAGFGRTAVTITCDPGAPGVFALPLLLRDRFAAIGGKIVEVPSPGRHTGVPATILDDTGSSALHAETAAVELHNFTHPEAEADWIAGTAGGLIASGVCRAGDIMIAGRWGFEPDSPLARALRRHGIPVEDGVRRPLAAIPLIRFALDALDASIDPDEARIEAVLRSSYGPGPATPVRAGRSAGDDRAWSCMIAEADSPDGFAASFRRMLDWLGVEGRLNGAGDPLRAAEETAAYRRLLAALDEFAVVYGQFRPMLRAGEFRRLLRMFLEQVMVPGSVAPGRGALLLGAAHARYVRRPVVFLAGLDMFSFPADTGRFTLHDRATADEVRRRREAEEPLLFFMTLAGAERLFLTFPGIDDEGGDAALSPYVRRLRDRLGDRMRVTAHRRIAGDAGEAGGTTPRGRLERILRHMVRGDHAVAGYAGLRAADQDAWIAIDRAASVHERVLDGGGMDLHDPDTLDMVARRWNPDRPVAVTDLERYLDCPVAFFFTRVLGLEPEPLAADGLSPMELGRIVHHVLAGFFPACRESFGTAMLDPGRMENYRRLMRTVVDTVFVRNRDDLRRFPPQVLAAEKRAVVRWMLAVLEVEASLAAGTGFVPERFEVAFGDGGLPALEVAAEGAAVKVSGRIDRIDVSPAEGISRVIDYKLQRCPAASEIAAGTVLQLPLYLRAVSELVLSDLPASSGMYYSLRNARFDGRRGTLTGCPVVARDGSLERIVAERAVSAAGGMAGGSFPAPDSCGDRCMFRSLCRGGRHTVPGGEGGDE